jgi:hypothetical protein
MILAINTNGFPHPSKAYQKNEGEGAKASQN